MSDDEQQIRLLVARWHTATRDGDTPAVLALMTDDALFLAPGRAPMTKADFASLSQSNAVSRPHVEIDQHIDDLEISGALAFMRATLAVSITAPGGATMHRRGQTLTIFRKEGNRWLLFRDANLLAQIADQT